MAGRVAARANTMADLDTDARIAELDARYREALSEIARLSIPDDHGAGMRTARLAGIGAWEVEAARLRRELETLTGAPWPPPRGDPHA